MDTFILISIITVASLVLIVGLILFYVFVIRRRNIKKSSKDLEKKYRTYHTMLIEDCDNAIRKIESIANQNLEYIQYHENFSSIYQSVLQNNDRSAYVAISGLNSTIAEKKYKGITNLINSTKQVVSEFEKKVTELDNSLNALLKKDEEFHEEEIQLQRLYRAIKEKYSNHEEELSIMKNSFDKVFSKIDSLFKECEDLTDAARYEESNAKLPVIKQVLDQLNTQIDLIPSLCVRISSIVPSKMEEVKQRFDELSNLNYPLHHLKVMSRLESYKEILQEDYNKVLSFNFAGVQADLDGIDEDIISIFKNFDEEIQAKEYFDAHSEMMYNETYDLEKQFMKIKRKLPKYKEVYLIKDKYLQQVDELEKDIDNVSHIKRDLDTFIHSSTKQPFTFIVKRMNDMQSEMKRITEIITDFNTYLDSLKVDSNEIYSSICSYFIKLKNAQAVIREMNVPSFTERFKSNFERSYAYLEEIGDIIKVQPIDVHTALDDLNYAKDLIENLLKEIEDASSQRKLAEESIVYANQYRQSFIDVKFALNSAGSAFFEGDFTRTSDQTVAILKKMRPEAKDVR
jgi:septation ring formation regulator EzrA